MTVPQRREAAERVLAFLDAAGTLVEGDVLFGVPGKGMTLLLSDMRTLAEFSAAPSPTENEICPWCTRPIEHYDAGYGPGGHKMHGACAEAAHK